MEAITDGRHTCSLSLSSIRDISSGVTRSPISSSASCPPDPASSPVPCRRSCLSGLSSPSSGPPSFLSTIGSACVGGQQSVAVLGETGENATRGPHHETSRAYCEWQPWCFTEACKERDAGKRSVNMHRQRVRYRNGSREITTGSVSERREACAGDAVTFLCTHLDVVDAHHDVALRGQRTGGDDVVHGGPHELHNGILAGLQKQVAEPGVKGQGCYGLGAMRQAFQGDVTCDS